MVGRQQSDPGTVGTSAAPAKRPPALRAFGTASADLDLEFGETARPFLVSKLLARCVSDAPEAEELVWDWTVEERLQGLIGIALASGVQPEPITLRCRGSDCRADMQIDLDPAAFVATPQPDPVLCRSEGGETIVARLPRGRDLKEWGRGGGEPAEMAARLIETVDDSPPPVDWRMPAEWIEALGQALAERDPLTALDLAVACPQCGETQTIDLDLEAWLLGLLAGAQDRLLDEVHVLATAYHWSEAAICALPAWRRRAYIRRVRREDA